VIKDVTIVMMNTDEADAMEKVPLFELNTVVNEQAQANRLILSSCRRSLRTFAILKLMQTV
jgi:hypothetical protein